MMIMINNDINININNINNEIMCNIINSNTILM